MLARYSRLVCMLDGTIRLSDLCRLVGDSENMRSERVSIRTGGPGTETTAYHGTRLSLRSRYGSMSAIVRSSRRWWVSSKMQTGNTVLADGRHMKRSGYLLQYLLFGTPTSSYCLRSSMCPVRLWSYHNLDTAGSLGRTSHFYYSHPTTFPLGLRSPLMIAHGIVGHRGLLRRLVSGSRLLFAES